MKHNKFWFEMHDNGIRLIPTTWEGWLTVLLLMTLLLISVQTNGFFGENYTADKALRFIFDAFLLCSIFCLAIRNKIKIS